MLQPWQKGTVIKIEDETPSVRKFFVQANELEQFDFKPGQFVTLDLPIHEQKNKRWRSYSIASCPDNSNIFELVVVLLENGAGSTYLFNEIKEGSELTFRGPQGVFVLPENLDKPLFLICTGTGVAPFRSMVNYIHKNNIEHKDIYLIFGCRKFGDALYADELKELAAKLNGFHYIPTFSREEQSEAYKTGYVHNVYETIYKNLSIESDFMLCGWKNMIDEAKERILKMGVEKKNIHLELYG